MCILLYVYKGAIRIWLRELEGSDCAIVVENRDNTGSGQYVSIEVSRPASILTNDSCLCTGIGYMVEEDVSCSSSLNVSPL